MLGENERLWVTAEAVIPCFQGNHHLEAWIRTALVAQHHAVLVELGLKLPVVLILKGRAPVGVNVTAASGRMQDQTSPLLKRGR